MNWKKIAMVVVAFLVYKKLSAPMAPENGNALNQMSRSGLQNSFGNPAAMPPVDRSAISQG